MATFKQVTEAYKNLQKAKQKLRKAIRDAEKVGLLESPDQYSDGYYRGFNEMSDRIERFTEKPLASALQSKLRKDVYGY